LQAVIESAVQAGLSAQRIYQDLICDHAFTGGYHSVQRFVRQLLQTQPVFLQLREPLLGEAEFERLFGRLIRLRQTHPLRIIVSSRHPSACWQAVDGVHLTGRDLAAATIRPSLPWVAASCHHPDELVAADRLGCDFAVFGPVAPTDSHPGAASLGFAGLSAQIAASPIPVYALGGVTAQNARTSHDDLAERDLFCSHHL
jgi:8-oxo-dGTP diphosphatase